MKMRNLIPAVLLYGALVPQASAANVVLNGDFSAGTNWFFVATDPPAVFSEISSGVGRVGYDFINFSERGAGPVLQQVGAAGTIDASLTYTLSFDASVENTNFAGVNFQVGLNIGGSDILGPGGFTSITPGPGSGQTHTTTPETFTFSGLTPGNLTTDFNLQFLAAVGPVDGAQNTLIIDNVSLQADAIPEPSSLALFLLATSCGLFRRRRS